MEMFKFGLLFILAYLIYLNGISANKSFFRKDYTLFSEVGMFYKLHKDLQNWNNARKICTLEGATLAVPRTAVEAEIYSKMITSSGEPITQFVFIGVQAFSNRIFAALDGTLIEDLYHGWNDNEPNDAFAGEDCVSITHNARLNDISCNAGLNFICEKSQNTVIWNEDCQIADPDYHRLDGMDHCYKLHVKQKNWADAYATCIGEESYLAILNSKKEWEAMKKLYNDESRRWVKGGNNIIHLGFHDRSGEGEFETIQGVSLAEAGFDEWSTDQPDHPGKEKCGSMFVDAELNDVNCTVRSYFICEHEDGSALSLRKGG